MSKAPKITAAQLKAMRKQEAERLQAQKKANIKKDNTLKNQGWKKTKGEWTPEREAVSILLWRKFLSSLPASTQEDIVEFHNMNRVALYNELENKLKAEGYERIKEDAQQCDLLCDQIINSLSNGKKDSIISHIKKGHKQENHNERDEWTQEHEEISQTLWTKFLSSVSVFSQNNISKFPNENRSKLYRKLEGQLQDAGYEDIKEDKEQCDMLCDHIINNLSDKEKFTIILDMRTVRNQEHKSEHPNKGKKICKGCGTAHKNAKTYEDVDNERERGKKRPCDREDSKNQNTNFSDDHAESTTINANINANVGITLTMKDGSGKPQMKVAGFLKNLWKHPDLSQSDKDEIAKTQKKVETSHSSQDAATHVKDLQDYMEEQARAQPQKQSLYQKIIEFLQKAKEYLHNLTITTLFSMKKSAEGLDRSRSNIR